MDMSEQNHLSNIATEIEPTHNYLKNIDGLTGMKSIPSGIVDLILTDPPYNIADKNKLTKVGNKIVSTNEAWGNDFQDAWANIDKYYEWLKPFLSEYYRALKNNGSLLIFLDRKYTGLITYYIERDFGLIFRNKVYFSKVNPIPSMRRKNYRSKIEECVFFTKGKQYTFNFGEQRDMTQVYEGPIGRKKTKHPTEKYQWMIEPLIKNHSLPGQTVLDSFAGSGTTLAVAKKMNRNVIGFEQSTKFFEMAKERCEADQLELNFS